MSVADKKTSAFLQALEEPSSTTTARIEAALVPSRAKSRTGLKHIGGYLDREAVEKVAVLRARLGLDNSQLIRLAVEDLYKKHNAQRAFSDPNG